MFFWKTRAQRVAKKWLRYQLRHRLDPNIISDYRNVKTGEKFAGRPPHVYEGDTLLKDRWLVAMKEDHSYSEIFNSHGIEFDTVKLMLNACWEYMLPATIAVKLSDKTNLKKALVSWKTEHRSRFVTLMRSL